MYITFAKQIIVGPNLVSGEGNELKFFELYYNSNKPACNLNAVRSLPIFLP